MKRFLLFLAIAGLVAPARAQLFNAPMTPTPPARLNLGAGRPTALANPPNTSGGVTTVGGTLRRQLPRLGRNGIQDTGSPCAHGADNRERRISAAQPSVATSLANRATDFGVTFNLKTDFGAKCDGSTDDTTGDPELAEQGRARGASCCAGRHMPVLLASDGADREQLFDHWRRIQCDNAPIYRCLDISASR